MHRTRIHTVNHNNLLLRLLAPETNRSHTLFEELRSQVINNKRHYPTHRIFTFPCQPCYFLTALSARVYVHRHLRYVCREHWDARRPHGGTWLAVNYFNTPRASNIPESIIYDAGLSRCSLGQPRIGWDTITSWHKQSAIVAQGLLCAYASSRCRRPHRRRRYHSITRSTRRFLPFDAPYRGQVAPRAYTRVQTLLSTCRRKRGSKAVDSSSCNCYRLYFSASVRALG